MAITICRAVIIYFFVILAVRVMGRRQVGELSTHEFVITILISAVATIPLEDNELPLSNSLIPILVFISFEIIESAISLKSRKFRDFIQGKPIFVIKDGTLQTKQMKKLRLTLDDILDALRQKDIFDISEVENAIAETNGTISVQKKNEHKTVPIPVAEDGEAVVQYFGDMKFSKEELAKILDSTGEEAGAFMLLTVDKKGNTKFIKKEETK